jgi:hypothetical protein
MASDPLKSMRQYLFRINGAEARSGKDVEVTIEAMNQGDACQKANQRGIFVSSSALVQTVAVSPGSQTPDADDPAPQCTFAHAMREDKIVQDLLKRVPWLAGRIEGLNTDDSGYLANLAGTAGVSHRDLAHLQRLIEANRHLPSH